MNRGPGAQIGRIRVSRGWTLAELARRAGISRQSLLTIEQGHVPRADTAVKLAGALGTTVERLFSPTDEVWAGTPAAHARWTEIDGRLVLHPTTSVVADVRVREDGRWEALPGARPPDRVLAVAGCDPALPLVAQFLERQHPGWFCDVLAVSSRAALTLFEAGLVHVAGLHLFHPDGYNRPHVGPGAAVRQGIRAAAFEVGFAARQPNDLAEWPARWQGGTVAIGPAGAETAALATRTAQAHALGPPRHTTAAPGHDESARLVAADHADLAVIPRAVAELHGLQFLPLAVQPFDWVAALPLAPGVERLLATLAHPTVQRALGGLAGYSLEHSGHPVWVVDPLNA